MNNYNIQIKSHNEIPSSSLYEWIDAHPLSKEYQNWLARVYGWTAWRKFTL